MLRRALKNGFVAKYLLADKWFFGKDFFHEVRNIRKGLIHIVTLLKKKDTNFMVNGKRFPAKVLISMHERKGDFTSCRRYKSMYVRVRAEIADCTLAFIAYSVISLRKRFSDYETLGDLFRDIRDGLLELTFIERLLPVIAELLERIAILFDSTLDELLEKAIADPETRMVLECILRYNQDFKDRA